MGAKNHFQKLAIAGGLLGALTMFSGCLGDGDGARGLKVKPELMRADAGGSLDKVSARAHVAADAPHWSSDMNVSSLRVPIKQISLHSASFDHEADIYTCRGSNDECLVELAGTAFQDALDAAPATVEMGEYAYVFVKTCEDGEGQYTSYVSGDVSLDDHTWYTQTASVLDTAGPAAPVAVVHSGCGRTYALPHPLRITDSLGSQVSFKLYFDLQSIAYAALGSRATGDAWSPGGCTGDRPQTDGAPPFVCIGYPDVSGIIDSLPVSLERYRINNGAVIGLFFTADDIPVGGYTRKWFQEGAPWTGGFEAVMPIRDLSKNADGTLSLAEFGGGDRGMVGSEFQVTSFPRETHDGTFTGRDYMTGADRPGTYHAVRLGM